LLGHAGYAGGSDNTDLRQSSKFAGNKTCVGSKNGRFQLPNPEKIVSNIA
jgi:hypothetical protein